MTSLSIHPFKEDNRSCLKELWERCGLIVSHNNPDDDINFALQSPSSEVLVGMLSDQLVASVMVGYDGHRGWLYYVAVDPKHQKSGAGRAIVAAAEKWLKEKGVRKSMLLIRETNESVKKFYERLDYEMAPVIVMQRWL
jgi:ribosomal protein S18 acetylase RimI-like enzyme